MAVHEDLVEGARVSYTSDGIEATRVFHVTGLTGDKAARGYFALVNEAGIPQHGEAHPVIPNIFCLSREARAEDTKQVKVTCTYSPISFSSQPPDESPSSGILEIGATVQSTTTQLDVNRKQIFTEYRLRGAKEPTLQGGRVDINIPQPVLRVTRRETTSPWQKSLKFVGKVNNATWNGQGARKWLCTNISGSTEDGGLTYEVTYEFQYNDETWDPNVTFILADTGDPPHDALDYPGAVKSYQVYPAVSFDSVGVSF